MWQGRKREYITSGGLWGLSMSTPPGGVTWLLLACWLVCQPRVADALGPSASCRRAPLMRWYTCISA
jgi:hypothetical protein